MMRKLFVLMSLVLMTTGCEKDNEAWQAPAKDAEAICFSVEVGTTRAANAMEAHDDLAASGGFGVFGCYTGPYRFMDSDVQSDFMYNQHVIWDGVNGVWTYDPVKYWPNGEGQASSGQGAVPHYVSFFAYAPYSNQNPDNAAGYCIPTFNLQQEHTNPWLTYRLHPDPAQQVDLMYAVPLIDRTKAQPTTRMTFTFRHALACVGDQVTVGVSEALKTTLRNEVTGHDNITRIEVLLKSVMVSYHLTERARLVLWTGGEANWQVLKSGEALTTREVALKETSDLAPVTIYSYDKSSGAGGSDWTDSGHGVFYIPLHRNEEWQTAEVNIAYDVVTTYGVGMVREEKTSTTTLTLSDFPDAYQAGRNLNLVMKMNR